LRQINLALLSGRSNGLPLWYTSLPGSLNDCKTLKNLVKELHKLEAGKFSLVMDRGFYSAENLRFLVENGIKFMIPVPNKTNWHKTLILQHRDSMFAHVDGYIPSSDGSRLLQSKTVYHPFADGSRAWVHIYYDSEIRSQAEQQFMAEYKKRYDEFASGSLDPDYREYYETYFTHGYKTRNGQKVIARLDPVKVFNEDISGYWCIYTTSEKDAEKALNAYRERNDIKMLFDDLKNALDCSRLRVHTKNAMQGRLFVQFIALVILTEFKKAVKAHNKELVKYGNYRSVLKRVASFSQVKFSGKYKDLCSAPTKGQEDVFNAFGIK
jgi:transposase